MRHVAIATPSYDGKLTVGYVNSLIDTYQLANSEHISVTLLTLSNEAIVSRARNSLLRIAHDLDITDVIWIDADISWNPIYFMKLLKHSEDVVGGTYRHKSENESYVLKAELPIADKSIVQVTAVGFGFVKTSKKAIDYLWDSSETYQDNGLEHRNAFEVTVHDGELWSEDVNACLKLSSGGFPIYLDKHITCDHTGTMTYRGNFYDWSKRL